MRVFDIYKRNFAGHNKWSKIKRDKSVNDSNKCMLFGKVSSQIISAINAGNGETDPSLNLYLASALNKAKQIQMPKSNIDQALLRAKSRENLKTHQIFYEGFGPSGIALIVEALTPNRNKTFNEVRHLFMENGSLGSVNYLFRRSAFFTISTNDLEKASNDIIESNFALNLLEISETEMEVETLVTETFNFQKFLKGLDISVSSTDIRHEPMNRISIPNSDKMQIEEFIEDLKDIDEVVGVYHNALL